MGENMKFNNTIFLGVLLLAVLTIGAVSAAPDSNSSDLSVNELDGGADIVQAPDMEDTLSGSEIDAEDSEIFRGDEDVVATITFPEDAKGKIYVYVDGVQAKVRADNEEFEDRIYVSLQESNFMSIDAYADYDEYDFSFSDLPIGNYSIMIKYVDSYKKGNDANKTFNLVVDPSSEDDEETGVDIDMGDHVFILTGDDEPEFVAVNFPEDALGNLYVYINGTKAYLRTGNPDDDEEDLIYVSLSGTKNSIAVNAEEDYESYEISFYKLPEGNYSVTIHFEGKNGKYTTYKSAIFTVTSTLPPEEEEEELEIDIEPTYMYGGRMVLDVYDSIVSSLRVVINGTDYPIITENDVKFVDLSSLGMGSYDIVIFNGSDVLVNESLEIGGIISISNDEFSYKDDEKISLMLPKDAEGNLIVNYNKHNIVVPVINGSASVPLNDWGVGTYSVAASYDGDDYDVEECEFGITIYPKTTYPKTMKVNEDKYIIFELNKDAIGSFVVSVDWDFYYGVNVVDGFAKVPLSKLDDGEWGIGVEYTGSTESDMEWEFDIEILPVPPKLIAKNVKMNYLDGNMFSVQVYGTNGRPAVDELVEIYIGNKYYEKWTDKNGFAKVKITSPPGKYKVKVNYDDEVKITKSLLVKKTLRLSTAKVKKSAKQLVLKATLKQGKKPIKNKKITFKFNGKKLTAKTNKKGVATVTFSKSVLKKLKVGKKVKYQATYVKETVKKVAKVKK